ncbi:MAG: hypothetical protein KME54_18405 [Tolypothrix brevis GSE-NOS-MK-07-07A]|nr:hypothetical protein [Tolypothrix brevis GSE-NOS-MK-07-07A]
MPSHKVDFGGDRVFSEPQRHREHRGRRERSLGRIHILLLMLQPSH